MYIKLIGNNPWSCYSLVITTDFLVVTWLISFHTTVVTTSNIFTLPHLSLFLKQWYICNLTTLELTAFKTVIAVIHKITKTLTKGRKGVSCIFPAASRACFHAENWLPLINNSENHDPKAARERWNGKSLQPKALFPQGDNDSERTQPLSYWVCSSFSIIFHNIKYNRTALLNPR